jgi:hypothetical protein
MCYLLRPSNLDSIRIEKDIESGDKAKQICKVWVAKRTVERNPCLNDQPKMEDTDWQESACAANINQDGASLRSIYEQCLVFKSVCYFEKCSVFDHDGLTTELRTCIRRWKEIKKQFTPHRTGSFSRWSNRLRLDKNEIIMFTGHKNQSSRLPRRRRVYVLRSG